MEEIMNATILDFLAGYKEKLATMYEDYIAIATGLCAIFALICFSLKAYEMMVGDRRLEVLSLFRPFALLMVILYWTPFIEMVSLPGKVVMENAKEKYEANIVEINSAEAQRQKYMVDVYQRLLFGAKEAKEAEDISNQTADEKIANMGK
ncbi:hypothetical protein V9K67_21735 [Paraflavisolibacter sp. H34]|uniref:hypothetical protein n=1 Tax=Huijunlia imazamoxiresistens TaxID=3127457 RepID=UPI00301865E8